MTSQSTAPKEYIISFNFFYKKSIHFFAQYYMNNIAKYQRGKVSNIPLKENNRKYLKERSKPLSYYNFHSFVGN